MRTFSVVETECLFKFLLHGFSIFFLKEVAGDSTELLKIDFAFV
jgi:hypothetical protein